MQFSLNEWAIDVIMQGTKDIVQRITFDYMPEYWQSQFEHSILELAKEHRKIIRLTIPKHAMLEEILKIKRVTS